MPDVQTPNDINGKYQAMKFAEWKGAIGEKVENMDDRLIRVESKLDKLIPRVAGIGATIALIVTILVLLTRSAFGTLTDFSFADRDTVIADKDGIFFDYHFKIYRTDTIASWPIEVDDYENFACYIEGNTLPHSDSFAIGAVYYQSGTYDSLFSRIPGYERSVLDTAITDTIGQWHTFYPLLKYVKIYIYGDTIGTAANPVSSADSNTVRVRVRLSKWKGTQMRIPGTGVHAHHHDEFVGDLNIYGFVMITDSVVTPRLIATDSANITTLLRCPDVVASDSLTTNRAIVADSVNTARVIATDSINITTLLRCPDVVAIDSLTTNRTIVGDSVNTPRLVASDSVNVGTLLRCPDITATDSLTSARLIASDSVNVTTLLRCPDVVAADSVTTARLIASDSINAPRVIITDSLNVPTVTILDSLHVPWVDIGDSVIVGTLLRCPDIIATDSLTSARVIVSDSVNVTTLLRCPDVMATDSLTSARAIASDSVNTARLIATDSVNVTTLLRCPDITASDSLTTARVIADSLNVGTLVRTPFVSVDTLTCDSLETVSASIDTITAAVVFKAVPLFNATINFSASLPKSDIGGLIPPLYPFGAAFGENLHIAGGLPSSFDTTLNLTVAASGTDCPALSIPNSDVGMTIKPGSWPFNIAGYLTTGIFFNSSGWLSFMGDNDEFCRIQVLGGNKGDVIFFDNAATPAQKMLWDAGTERLRPAADHGANLGSGAYAFDTLYVADVATTTSMFSGTGDEALSILATVQALPGDRLDHEVLHPYLSPSSPNTVSLNRWIGLLTVAVQELEKKNQELEEQVWLLQGAMDLEELSR